MAFPKFAPGDRIGALTIVQRDGTARGGSVIWLTKCDCGTAFRVPSDRLSGRVRSCGCLPLAPGPSGHRPRTGFPSQQELQKLLDYDPTTGVFRWKAPTSSYWRGNIGGTAGGTDINGYVQIRLAGVTYKAHHLAWIYVHGAMHSMPQTDHIDGNRSNNVISNLRPCSNTQNQANQKRRNLSGLPKGVRRSTRGKPFIARISFQKRLIHIGTYDTAEEAAQAYFKAAQKFYGEFARQDGGAKP